MPIKPLLSTPKVKTDDRYKTTIGYQRNNPGNITVRNIPYLGKAHDQEDSGPISFMDRQSGLRALAMDIKMKLKHPLTLEQFVSRYAPKTENDVGSYADFLSDKLNLEKNHNIPYNDDTHMQLMDAVIRMEIGYGQNPYSDAEIKQAIEDAKTSSVTLPTSSDGGSSPDTKPTLLLP